MPTPAEVFDVICRRYKNRAVDLLRCGATGYSFEEWLNWEAFLECDAIPGWDVRPKPQYPDSQEYGDLMVVNEKSAGQMIVEFKLIHSETSGQYYPAVNADWLKVSRLPSNGITGLLVIVVIGKRTRIDDEEMWQRWLRKIDVWNNPATLAACEEISPCGRIMVRGYVAS